jgi:methylated-DNA-protein-cysteine methyltransferase related protein
LSRKAPPLSPNVALSNQSGGKSYDNQGQVPDRRTDRRTMVWQVVAMIPAGQVATYGQIAALIGLPSHARFVGTTLRQLPKNTRLPWHRVVNAGLRISQRGGGEAVQRERLEAEGVEFVGGKIPNGFRWEAG